MNNCNILVVDDSRDSLSIIQRMLKKAGYQRVRPADSGEIALAAVAAEKPDLILLDARMTGIDGLEVCRRLKQDDNTRDIPIIFISGAADSEERVNGLSAGAVDYVIKPFDSEELLARVKIQLEIQRLKSMLAQEKNKIQFILSSSPVGMVVFNGMQEIIYANPAAESLFNNCSLGSDHKRGGDFMLCENRRKDARGSGYSEQCSTCPIFNSIREVLNSDSDQIELNGETCLHTDGRTSPLYARFKVKPLSLDEERCALLSIEDVSEGKQAEVTLRESEERFHQLFEKAPLGYQSLDSDGRFIDINFAWLETLGYRREEVIGKWFGDFLAPEYEQAFRERFPVFKAEGKVHSEFHMMHKDGRRRYISFDGRVGHNADGSFKQTHCILKDDTERKEAEEKLRESEELLSRSQKIAHTGSWKLDLSTNRLTWSDEVYRIFGCKPQEFVPTYEAFLGFVHPGDRAALDDAYSRSILEGADGYEFEHRIVRRNSGEDRYVHERCVHERDDAGSIIQSTGMVQDITERKRAEAALNEREMEYQELIENMSSAVVVHSGDTKILISNPMAENLLGLTKDQMQGKTALDPSWCFIKEDLTPFLPVEYPVSQVISSGKPLKRQMLGICRPDRADPVWVLCDGYPIIDADGHILKVVVSFVDVTERKLAERERGKLEAQLRQSQKMEAVGQLAGGIAHDFNNMLTVINVYSEMLLMEIEPDSPRHARIKEINKAGLRSAALTQQLLAFARKQNISPEVLDLNDTVTGMLMLLQRLIGENIKLVWEPSANLWKVKMDPSQINQLLANLIVNARDAISGAGKIVIETGKADLDETFCKDHPDFTPGEYVVLEVSDNGCGMDKNTIEHIFEPFFTTKKVGEGTGLGLATVFGIIKQNKGSINVYSEPGKGTTFKLYLPRHVPEVGKTEGKPGKIQMAGGKEAVLLVEDEEAILKLSKDLMVSFGYTVLDADSPIKAIRLAGEYKGEIHLLMTDVIMPEMSGRELKDKINEMRPGIKCLFMSGYTAEIMSEDNIREKGFHFLEKPFTAENLSVKLREALA
ncbi:MAG: PAS domain S-box protein [Victivallales bacterium]